MQYTLETMKARVAGITSVVVHDGVVHRDDFMVMAIMAYLNPGIVIHRRTPTPDDIKSDTTMVADVGDILDYDKLCFDHHQLQRTQQPTCAVVEVMRWLGLLDAMTMSSKWVDITAKIDDHGPYAAAAYLKIPTNVIFKLRSPVEDAVLNAASRVTDIHPDSEIHGILRLIGHHTVDYAVAHAERLELLEKVSERLEVKGLTVMIIPTAGLQRPALAMDTFRFKICPDNPAVVSVVPDDRGPGWSMFRYDDDPRVDFRRIATSPKISYVHGGGFLAKTTSRISRAEIVELLESAIA